MTQLILVRYNFVIIIKKFAPGEARTHGLQIMRLTRCLLRYRGLIKSDNKSLFENAPQGKLLSNPPNHRCKQDGGGMEGI